MNLFSQIEGLRQEEMATALLRYLIVGSPAIREEFVRFLSDHSHRGPLLSESFFSCMTEFATRDETEGDGRLDMLLTMDGAVVGIENKFYADFQQGQPQKYMRSVKAVAESQSHAFGQETHSQIYILVPRSRMAEAEKNRLGTEDFPIIVWEELVDRLRPLTETLVDPDIRMVLIQFLNYLNEVFGFMPDYRQIWMHTRRDWEPKGTPLQKHFMQKLWRFLPSGGSRLSQGENYIGYKFFEGNPAIEGWCGFISTYRLINQEGNQLDTKHSAELVLSSSKVPDAYSKDPEVHGLRPINLQSKWWFSSGRKPYAWIVEYDDKWDSADRWHTCMAPLREMAIASKSSIDEGDNDGL